MVSAENVPRTGTWKKYHANPILGGPELGTCFDVHVRRIETGYRMYFSWRPKKSIACVEGPDGIHWSAPELILSPWPESGWEDEVNRNCVVYHDGIWHMWYTGQARDLRYSWIGYARSRDGKQFERVSSEPVMIPEQPWERESVMNPFVCRDEERQLFRMWYAAGETSEPNAIGYAESSDGVNWKKCRCNPIFTAGHEPYEKNRVGGCEVLKNPDGTWTMFYIGYETIHTASICAATSPDGLTRWERFPNNPLVSPSPGEWDGEACYKPSVLFDPEANRWMLWYNGRQGQNEYIGLAMLPGTDSTRRNSFNF